ncbi:hypothetical protein V2J09_009741 [Rumex salicifolius]
MPREDAQLSAAKRAYRSAKEVGNRREEARWANVIGDIFKNRGEYVESLKWLRIDFKISSDSLSDKDLLPTCQSIGEIYLRLQNFEDALHYQKEHLRLAKEANDLVEQQRASTQLGRTYHEMFMRSDNDHAAIHNAKRYFKSAMGYAQSLKENPPSNRSFLKEYIDAHNNIGMLEMDLDNLEEAEKFLTKGLQICNEEEVNDDDDARSRLHHNLGSVYTELRVWDKAREHIKKDIMICKQIGHLQGEAKGYINLGELHYRVQKYEEALLSYQKALDLAKTMEDEDALADQINGNIRIVKQAVTVMHDMKKEEQNLKKLRRKINDARGTSNERKCLRQQMTSIDLLIDKASMICAWSKHREFAKMKKRIASELIDKEKLSDSYLVIGESYQKLRKFNKAKKWCTKSLEIYKLIGNLEGQALAKINIGGVLDSDGDWMGAFNAFEEGYRIAVQASLPSVQLSALENMHYSHTIRFGNVEEARRLQLEIDNLKQLNDVELGAQNVNKDCCPETETEGSDYMSDGGSDVSVSPQKNRDLHAEKPVSGTEEWEDEPLISVVQSNDKVVKQNMDCVGRISSMYEASPRCSSKSISNPQTSVGRKRVRLVLSDDEEELCNDVECRGRLNSNSIEVVATSNENKAKDDAGLACEYQDVLVFPSKCDNSFCSPVLLEESACSYKYSSSKEADQDRTHFKTASNNENRIKIKMEDDFVFIEPEPCMLGCELNIEALKSQAACSYYLQLPAEKRSNGLLPVIGQFEADGRALTNTEAIERFKSTIDSKDFIEASIGGWVQKRLIKAYVECCSNISQPPNMKLVKKLYNFEVSEDEVIVSNCELQDMSVLPLLDALQEHNTIATLDLSHNMLGNGTMEKLNQVMTLSNQKYGGFTLDLHCNLFGPTALFQICECPVLLNRLEVLNISGNRLTDACGSYLYTIVTNCKALYSLNIERCCITTRTIQKLCDALDLNLNLSHLSIGYNNPISGHTIISLLTKLSALQRFSELNLSGLKLNKPSMDSICKFLRSSSLSGLFLGATNIGCDEASQLTESLFSGTQELLKLDLSCCALTPRYFDRLKSHVIAFACILELNLGGNSFGSQGGKALASVLMNSSCCIKVLTLNKCCLGLSGIVHIVKALTENNSVEELDLGANVTQEERETLNCESKSKDSLPPPEQPCPKLDEKKDEGAQLEQFELDTMYEEHLEVADSDDDTIMPELATSGISNTCPDQRPLNTESLSHRSFQGLLKAIANAKNLRLLDLSSNGLSSHLVDELYNAWSSSLRSSMTYKHWNDHVLHLSVHGKICCGIKPCCRRD